MCSLPSSHLALVTAVWPLGVAVVARAWTDAALYYASLTAMRACSTVIWDAARGMTDIIAAP